MSRPFFARLQVRTKSGRDVIKAAFVLECLRSGAVMDRELDFVSGGRSYTVRACQKHPLFVGMPISLPVGGVSDMHRDVNFGDRWFTPLDPRGVELRTDRGGRSRELAPLRGYSALILLPTTLRQRTNSFSEQFAIVPVRSRSKQTHGVKRP